MLPRMRAQLLETKPCSIVSGVSVKHLLLQLFLEGHNEALRLLELVL